MVQLPAEKLEDVAEKSGLVLVSCCTGTALQAHSHTQAVLQASSKSCVVSQYIVLRPDYTAFDFAQINRDAISASCEL